MRIAKVQVFRHELAVVGEIYRMSHGEVTALDSTIVEIVTDTGVAGYGETCPVGPAYQPQHALGARAAMLEMGPHLIGQPALETETVHRTLERALSGHRYAKAAIDMALWDIAGKVFGVRVCDLLGGAVRERVPSYSVVGIHTPDESARVALDKQAQGFPRLQLKVGGRPVEEDIAAIRGVCEVLRPEVRLAVDANRGWTQSDALLVSLACRDLALVLEQPCNTFEECAAVRRRVPHPVYLDECTEDLAVVLRAVGEDAADGFGFKVTRLGGLSTMRTVRDLCRARGLPHTCDDTWGGDIVAAACVHLAATVEPRLCEGTWIAAPYIDGHYDPHGGVAIRDGWIDVPKGPGLGIAPDPSRWGDPVLTFA